MTTHIISNTPHIQVSLATMSPYFTMSSENPAVGQVRHNGASGNIEAWDGYSWKVISSSVYITVSSQVNDILNWAQKQMEQEKMIFEAAKSNPTIADALESYKHAAERLKLVAILSEGRKNEVAS